MEWKEIDQLKALRDKHNIRIGLALEEPYREWGTRNVNLHIGKLNWELLVDDEYQDFDPGNQLMCLFLTLSALKDYEETDDFLTWCSEIGMDPADIYLQNYFRDLSTIYSDICGVIGKIDTQLSNYDYHLGAGATRTLRDQKGE